MCVNFLPQHRFLLLIQLFLRIAGLGNLATLNQLRQEVRLILINCQTVLSKSEHWLWSPIILPTHNMWPVHLCQNIPTFLTLIINSFYLFNAQCLFNPVRSVLFLGLLPRTLTPTEKRVSVIIADPALFLGLE